jgi:hypothetical protein
MEITNQKLVQNVITAQAQLEAQYRSLEAGYKADIDQARTVSDVPRLYEICAELPSCPLRMRVAGLIASLTKEQVLANTPVTTTIKVTEDRQALWMVWGGDYADKHIGKMYTAVIRADGWADSDEAFAKFPPNVFTVA